MRLFVYARQSTDDKEGPIHAEHRLRPVQVVHRQPVGERQQQRMRFSCALFPSLLWCCFLVLGPPGFAFGQGASADGRRSFWIDPQRMRQLPTEGEAWIRLTTAADRPLGTPNISDQTDDTEIFVLAKALVYARTRVASYREQVIDACLEAIGTESGGRALAAGWNTGSYVIAADLVELWRDPASDDQFREWLRSMLTGDLSGKTLQSCHEDRPNNWGTGCGFSRIAIAAYLGDEQEIQRTAQVFEGYLGNRSQYAGFRFGDDLTWQSEPGRPVGINPKGSRIDGFVVDGVLPDDQRRGGSFEWPPPKENYIYTALNGAIPQAVILHRLGFDVWNWEDKALLRSVEWLHAVAQFPAIGDDRTSDDMWVPYVVNYFYNANFPTASPRSAGRTVDWTDWTHSGALIPGDTLAPSAPTRVRVE